MRKAILVGMVVCVMPLMALDSSNDVEVQEYATNSNLNKVLNTYEKVMIKLVRDVNILKGKVRTLELLKKETELAKNNEKKVTPIIKPSVYDKEFQKYLNSSR